MLAAGNRIRGRWCLPALASAGGSGEVRAGNRDLSQPCARLFLGDVSPQQWAWRNLGVSPEPPPNGAGHVPRSRAHLGSDARLRGAPCSLHPSPCQHPGSPASPPRGSSLNLGALSPSSSHQQVSPRTPPPGHLPPCPQPRSHLRAGVKAAAQRRGQCVTAAPHRFVLPPLGESTLASAPRHRVGHPQAPSTPLARPGPPTPHIGAAS